VLELSVIILMLGQTPQHSGPPVDCGPARQQVSTDEGEDGALPVCVSPNVITSLHFRFRTVLAARINGDGVSVTIPTQHHVALVGTDRLLPGERRHLDVEIQDESGELGGAPLSFTVMFEVVGRDDGIPRQIDLSIPSRRLCPGEADFKKKLEDCQREPSKSVLAPMLRSGLLMTRTPVVVSNHVDVTLPEQLTIVWMAVAQTATVDERSELGIALVLANQSSMEWRAETVEATGSERRLPGAAIVKSNPVAPGQTGELLLLVESVPNSFRGLLSLKVVGTMGEIKAVVSVPVAESPPSNKQ